VPGKRITLEDLSGYLACSFGTASGPGGQNVNHVQTRATLLLDFEACPVFSASERRRLRAKLGSRLARDGRLRIVRQKERSQALNRAAAEADLVELIREALAVQKVRRPTRPTAGSKRRRLDEKRRQSQKKDQRRRPPSLD
jgi:ribosome-associated protein